MTGRILILTLYYPPDLAAGSFRAAALVQALRAEAPDLAIDVLTSIPNRYHSYNTMAPEIEHDGAVTIRRLPMPVHRSDMLGQGASYMRFARRAARVAAEQRYDLVYATSSRLMTATLGAFVSRRSGAPLYLDIRDLFVDTMSGILSPAVAAVTGPVFSQVERWAMGRAAHVNLVSPGFESYFAQRYPQKTLSFFTNGIDEEFESPVSVTPLPEVGRRLKVVYAGNMGEGQGLHAIVPPLAKALGEHVHFRLIGDGGRRPQLVEALRASAVDNVELIPPMPRAALLAEYQAADVLFLHLNDYEAFTKVLPSKIFEYAALGKPILAGVAGYAAEFLRGEVPNAAVFAPCDVRAALQAWQGLDLRTQPRETFNRKYSRRVIMQGLAKDVMRYLPAGAKR